MHRPLLSPGVLVALCLVFLVCPVEVLPALDREPSETCAVEVECSDLPRSGAVGTERST